MKAHLLPAFVEGYGAVRPYNGLELLPAAVTRAATRVCPAVHGRDKLLRDIDSAFDACNISDGATLSFHHHLRNGDQVLNDVLAIAARRGLRDLRVAASSIFPVHAPLVEHIRTGVVTRLATAYASGPVANAISHGRPQAPCRHADARRPGRGAIESGELHIDIAFVAAPAADRQGNLSGAEGPAACGPLGYAMVDVQYADRAWSPLPITCALTPFAPIDISQENVDFVVHVDSIGDPNGILSGSTRPTTDSVGLQIASTQQRR